MKMFLVLPGLSSRSGSITAVGHTWSKSDIHALQKGIGSIGAGLNASGGSQVSFLKGLYVTFGQVHVVLEYIQTQHLHV